MTTSLRGKTAVVTGGSSGVGKATVAALVAEGVRVTAVARGADRLRALKDELGDAVATLQGDAADPSVSERIIREIRPDLVVLAAGVTPTMGPVDELDWDRFSEAWSSDVKTSFHFLRHAFALPLAKGSTIVILSSGAAIGGSYLSGGYAGAKRMQWLLAGYAQKISDAKSLGIRTIAVLPKQLIVGTTIGDLAASTYAATTGITAAEYMKRFSVPLDATKVAAAIMTALGGGVAAEVSAIGVSGTGFEPIG